MTKQSYYPAFDPHNFLLAIAAPSESARSLAQTIESAHHRLGAHRRAEAAIDAGDQPLAIDHLRETADALRDQARMLDEIRGRVDDAGDEDLVVGNL